MKNKVLFILHEPPPFHGSSVMGSYIKNSEFLQESFFTSYINLGTSRYVNEIGTFKFCKVLKYIGILLLLIKRFFVFKPDLCYIAISSVGLAFFKDALIVFIIKLFQVPIVIHMHNKGVSKKGKHRIYNFFYSRVFKNTFVILLSELLYYDIKKYVNREKIYICPNGIPDNSIEFSLIKPDPKIHPVRILFLSNLIQSKGVCCLLKACQMLKEKGVSFFCHFVGSEGDISKRNFIEIRKRLNLDDVVFYEGAKIGREKYEFISECDIFVFPTYYSLETFGLVNLEAMQFSLPVISTFEGAIPDIVEDGETGFLVPKQDVDKLVDRLECLITNPVLRKRYGANGRLKYERKFTLNHFERRLRCILEEIIRDK